MSVTGFIEDGQEVAGFIPARSGCWPDVNFFFRPTSNRQKDWLLDRIRREEATGRPGAFVDIASKYLADHLMSWDMKLRSGEPAPIDRNRIEALHNELFEKFFRIVIGKDDPGTGELPTEDIAREQEKNCEPG